MPLIKLTSNPRGIHKTLSIAGFDSTAGAGIQADLKTFSALQCYGMTVLTALPIQNTTGVKNCYALPSSAILEQLEVIFDDIIPDSIKIGMLHRAELIFLIANFLKVRAKGIPIVLDPVLAPKSGDNLLKLEALEVLKAELIPIVKVLTPNLDEAQLLINQDLKNLSDMELAANSLLGLGAEYVFLKGGHLDDTVAADLLIHKNQKLWFKSQRISSKNTHGTGCSLSSAIAAYLAKGYTVEEACRCAKNYIQQAIMAAKDLTIGHGHGPVHHFFDWW